MIAKIEKSEAVEALEAILVETDAVMVARGDLGVEIGTAIVPLIQKRIILAALERARPVITATQMLESMVHQRGADARRGERRRQRDPRRELGADAVRRDARAASTRSRRSRTWTGSRGPSSRASATGTSCPDASEEPTVGQAMSNAACDLAESLGAEALLVPTFTGRTASAVARLRPRRPIIGMSHHDYALRQMAIEWGVTPMLIAGGGRRRGPLDASVDAARASGLVAEGDLVVITAGTAVNLPGTTNVIKVDVA